MKYHSSKSTRQSGVVLIVSLIMLLLLTLIGLSGIQTTMLEEKMASNALDRNIAFQAAESTLAKAEKFILDNAVTATVYTGSNGLLDLTDNEPTDYFASTEWTAAKSISAENNFGIAANPRYIIKKIASLPGGGGAGGTKTMFRITARAVGKNPGTQVIVQEVYQKS